MILKHAGDEPRDLQVIFHYENLREAAFVTGAVAASLGDVGILGRECDHERCTLTFPAVEADIAVHQLKVFLYQIKAQTRALAQLGCGGGAEHALEDQRLVDGRYADTVVRDGNLHIVACAAYAARNSGVVSRILACV